MTAVYVILYLLVGLVCGYFTLRWFLKSDSHYGEGLEASDVVFLGGFNLAIWPIFFPVSVVMLDVIDLTSPNKPGKRLLSAIEKAVSVKFPWNNTND